MPDGAIFCTVVAVEFCAPLSTSPKLNRLVGVRWGKNIHPSFSSPRSLHSCHSCVMVKAGLHQATQTQHPPSHSHIHCEWIVAKRAPTIYLYATFLREYSQSALRESKATEIRKQIHRHKHISIRQIAITPQTHITKSLLKQKGLSQLLKASKEFGAQRSWKCVL